MPFSMSGVTSRWSWLVMSMQAIQPPMIAGLSRFLSLYANVDKNNIFVIIRFMIYSIHYYSESVQIDLLSMPATLQARYIGLTDRMRVVGANLGEPHTKAMGDGLFELRLMGAEGIARVMYCTLSGKRIVMLHGFIKKTQKTPRAELDTAIRRMKEVKHADAR
jgi:phage-related protein